jgi:hypothetical protein
MDRSVGARGVALGAIGGWVTLRSRRFLPAIEIAPSQEATGTVSNMTVAGRRAPRKTIFWSRVNAGESSGRAFASARAKNRLCFATRWRNAVALGIVNLSTLARLLG